MPPNIITHREQVTAEWLTRALTHSGALTHGVVESFDVDTGRGNWSTSARLALRYADGAQGTLPPKLFLKMVNTDLEDEFFGASEVTYYTRDYVGVEGAPLIRCYDAAYSEEQRRALRRSRGGRLPGGVTTRAAFVAAAQKCPPGDRSRGDASD